MVEDLWPENPINRIKDLPPKTWDMVLEDWQRSCSYLSGSGRGASDNFVIAGERGPERSAKLDALGEVARGFGFEVVSFRPVVGESWLVEGLRSLAGSMLAQNHPAWVGAKDLIDLFETGMSFPEYATPEGIPTLPPQRGLHTISALLSNVAEGIKENNGGKGGLMLSVDELQDGGSELKLLDVMLEWLNRKYLSAPVGFVAAGDADTRRAIEAAGVEEAGRMFKIKLLASLAPEG